MAEVIALAGWPPEVLAYAYAMYSRSSLSIRQSIAKITQEKSGKFFESYYFGYGHKSIGDNAHIPLAFENISEIAAYELEDEQLWDGQERATRYQEFAKPDAYFIPRSVRGSSFHSHIYMKIADFLIFQYAEYSKKCFEGLVANNPRPQEMKEDAYERALRARAFDVSRYWLFNGILTNVGQITSARTLEDQASRLMSSEYPELQELGQAMKTACCFEKPFCPQGKDEPPVAPTLVKYAAPNQFRTEIREFMRVEAKKLLTWISELKSERYVKLAPAVSLTDEVVATLLFEASNYPYNEILELVTRMCEKAKARMIGHVLEKRGPHDLLPRTFCDGYRLQYDISMDRGGERDLHRHRNCIQIHQQLNTGRGWDTPELIKKMGLADDYNEGMLKVEIWINDLKKGVGVDADYLQPFAFRSGTLYKMHLAQNVYMSELRSGTQGHFSYREVACQMHDQLLEVAPFLADKVRVTPFEQENLLKR